MKKILIILAVMLIGLIGLTYLITHYKKTSSPFPSSALPTPNQNQISRQNGLYITSASPINNSKDITPSSNIIVTFNRPFTLEEVAFSASPQIDFDTVIEKNDLIIEPRSPLNYDISYSYTIKLQNTKMTFNFKTIKSAQSISPDSNSAAAYQKDQEYDLKNNPDIFLANQTPYDGATFSITSHYVMEPTGHYAFTITLKDPDKEKARNDAFNWLKSLGLTEEQILSFDIENK